MARGMTARPKLEAGAEQGLTAPLTIRRVDAVAVALPLKKPMRMAGITIASADNVLARVEADNGTVGWGEAASAPTMTGDTLPGLVAAVEYLAPALIGQDARMRPALARRLDARLYGNHGARAAIDMALLDLLGRAAGLPVADLLGGAYRHAVRPLCLLGNATVEEDVAEARARRAQGYAFFKLKVAAKPLDQDIEATFAVRAALGADATLCADANGGFDERSARRYLDAVRDSGLLFLEQPLPPGDIEGMARLARRSAVPIGADESIHSIDDLEQHSRRQAAAGASLKFIKLGGVSALVKAAEACERFGMAVNVAGKTAESGIASAAIVHAGCAIADAAWGVSLTDIFLAADLVRDPLQLAPDGTIALPVRPGLGIEVDEAAVARFRAR